MSISAPSARTPVVIVGSGAQGRVIQAIIETMTDVPLLGFVDDKPESWGQRINGLPVLGGIDETPRLGASAILAVGRNDTRRRLAERVKALGVPLFTAIHASAAVARTARIAPGGMIAAQTVVNTGAVIGENVVINNGAVVEHDCRLGNNVNISPGVQLGGRVTIEDEAFVATGAIVLARRTVGAGAIVAAGSVVTRDVEPHTLVLGAPARVVERIGPDFDWQRLF